MKSNFRWMMLIHFHYTLSRKKNGNTVILLFYFLCCETLNSFSYRYYLKKIYEFTYSKIIERSALFKYSDDCHSRKRIRYILLWSNKNVCMQLFAELQNRKKTIIISQKFFCLPYNRKPMSCLYICKFIITG